MPDQRERLSHIFAEALNHQGADRADFLRQACGGDESLRVEVESLLAHSGAPLSVLDVPMAAWAADALQNDGELIIGRSIGAYRILSTLGAGSMGEVYRARDTKLGRDVAIKILPRLFTTDATRQSRFDREAHILASLNHPHIAAIYGVEETADGIRALVLELVDGETLEDRLHRGPVPLADALGIARQIADALEAAHERGIVHRDLKPANIKVAQDVRQLRGLQTESGCTLPQGFEAVLTFGGRSFRTASQNRSPSGRSRKRALRWHRMAGRW